MTDDELFQDIIKQEALDRHNAHRGHASSRPLSENYEYIGLRGEVEFAKLTGQMVDLTRRLRGDKGIDFIVPMMFTIDVKTARRAFNLIHEEGKPFADIYILAQYDDELDFVSLIGWEWGHILKKAPVQDFGYGINNHYIAAEELRPMETLIKRVGNLNAKLHY